jgi:hypothetical protein
MHVFFYFPAKLEKWEEEWDERLEAHVERIAEEMGCAWWDIENRDLLL